MSALAGAGLKIMFSFFDSIEVDGVKLEATPYFLNNVTGDGEVFSMWSPTPCDVLAEDWVEVHV